MLDKLSEMLADHQTYHSELQIDCFITASSGCTPYGQYKQSLREISQRWQSLTDMAIRRKLLVIDLEEMDEKAETETDKFAVRRAAVNRIKLVSQLDDIDRNMKDLVREFSRFYSKAVALKDMIGELTDDKRRQLDAEFWEHKARETAAMDLMGAGRLSQQFAHLIQYMPVDMRKRIVAACREPQSLIAWFTELDYHIDFTNILPAETIRKAIEASV